MSWTTWKPAVAREVLLLVAGVLWSAVGLFLVTRGVGWWEDAPSAGTPVLAGTGLGVALLAWRLGFSRLVQKNVLRIGHGPARACVFGFQAWKSYAVMASMIALGVGLRSSPIPKPYLAVMYTGVGGALFLASMGYYRHLGRPGARPDSDHPV